MTESPAIPPVRTRLWSRRWVRRLTYLLATGAAAAAALGWLSQQPFVDRWLVTKLDAAIREETGLSFQAERLELHPFSGRVVLYGPSLGGDLFRARRLEVQVDPYAFLRIRHFLLIRLESPRLQVDPERLRPLKLKPHPETTTSPDWRIDRIVVEDGQAVVDLPASGLPKTQFTFVADGRGRVDKQVWLDLRAPHVIMGEGPGRLGGDLALKGRITDLGVDTINLHARMGDSAVTVQGGCDFKGKALKAEASAGLDLGELSRLLPRTPKPHPAPASGFLDLKGRIQGPLANPTWTASVDGRQLQVPSAGLAPGTLRAAASGAPGRLRLERVRWESGDGSLTAEGAWTRAGGTTLDLQAEGLSLAPAAVYARAQVLRGLTGRFKGSASMPGAPWETPDLERVTFTGSGQFFKDGRQVGSVDLALADRRLRAEALELQLPEAGLQARGTALLTHKGVAGVDAEGEVYTDAADVADTLDAWKVTKERLDMSGGVKATASFRWTPAEGVTLDGSAEIGEPRWHGAHADRVRAQVALRKTEIRIHDIELEKAEGRGTGDIWISWVKNDERLDMCFTAFRLPVREGLRAADQGDLQIDGTGSGWARLYGPTGHILMEGQAVAEDARVYGLTLPATSGSFDMDLETLRIRAKDVRVADALEHLEGPGGDLNLRGAMELDAQKERWAATLRGNLDSKALGLAGPRLTGHVQGLVEGPLTAPLGPSQAPEGDLRLDDAHLALEGQALDGLEARLTFQEGRLVGQAGIAGMPSPILSFNALQVGKDRMDADLKVHLGPDSAGTASAAPRLTQGFLKDVALDYEGQGRWSPAGLTWNGTLKHFLGRFEGFQLGQARPGTFTGDTAGMDLRLDLEGRTLAADGTASPASTGMRLGGHLPFDAQAPMDLRLEGAAELANLKAIFDHIWEPGQFSLMSDLRPAGKASFDLRLVGKPAEPAAEGQLALKEGRLSARTYPQSIENLEFTAQFHGRDVLIPQDAPLRGVLAQGALAAWGRLTWGLGGLTDYNLNATLDDAQFRDLPEGFEINGSFNGYLRGNERDGGLLRGAIRAKSMLYQADINLMDLFLASALGGGGALKSLDPSDPLARIELDLDLHLDRPWEFDTNLLKLQGRPTGAFKIRGSLANPGLKGRMELLPGGRLTNLVPAGDLVLERGSVEFTDPSLFNPVLDLHGRIDVDPYLVTLDIGGTLDAFTAHPSSTPALRPDEIFAILVDPAAANKVGGTQGSLAQANVNAGFFSQGAGLLTTLGLAPSLERLRKTLSLDRVNLAYTGGANLTLTLEKSWDVLGHRVPLIYNYKQEGTQTTVSGNVELRFGNFVVQVGARQITGNAQTPGDTTVQGVQPSGEIRYTWTPK